MSRPIMKLLISALVSIILFSFVLPAKSAAKGKGIIIAHPSVAEHTLDAHTVRDIFLGKITKWKNGNRITVVVLRSGPVHSEFLKRAVGKNTRQFSTYWKKAVFTGTGMPHKSFGSEADIVKFVSSTPGAIGYVDSAAPHPGCTVIPIGGR